MQPLEMAFIKQMINAADQNPGQPIALIKVDDTYMVGVMNWWKPDLEDWMQPPQPLEEFVRGSSHLGVEQEHVESAGS